MFNVSIFPIDIMNICYYFIISKKRKLGGAKCMDVDLVLEAVPQNGPI